MTHPGMAVFISSSIAPDTFLLGLTMVVYALVRGPNHRADRVMRASVAAVLFVVLFGLNTRLPSVIADVFDTNTLTVLKPLKGAVGQALHIVTDSARLSGRREPFRGIDPNYLRTRYQTDYALSPYDTWDENVTQTALRAGFSVAGPRERAPSLQVTTSAGARMQSFLLTLRDADAVELATYKGQFRERYPFEAGAHASLEYTSAAVIQSLLHRNFVSYWLSRLARPPVITPPLHEFLAKTTVLSHPQSDDAAIVALEILSEIRYDPVRILTGPEWTAMTYDASRGQRCEQMVKMEIPGTPTMQGWILFTADPTGRNRARLTGTMLCESDAVWIFDYAFTPGETFPSKSPHRNRSLKKTFLTKYSARGNFKYRIALEQTQSGIILAPTVREENGLLSFDLVELTDMGQDKRLKKIIKARVAIPTVSAEAERS